MEHQQRYLIFLAAIGLIAIAGFIAWDMQKSQVDVVEETPAEQEDDTVVLTDDATEDDIKEENNTDAADDTSQTAPAADKQGSVTETETGPKEPLASGTQSGGTETESEDPDPTVNWRTYLNDGLGISFKFPRQWDIDENTRVGEYTVQAFAGSKEDKAAEFNVLVYTDVGLDADSEGRFDQVVNSRSAYTDSSACTSGAFPCVLKTVIFPLEDGIISDGEWRGPAIRITARANDLATASVKSAVNNIIGTFTILQN